MDSQPTHGSVSLSPEQISRDALIQHELDEVYLLIDHLSGRADRRISVVEFDSCLQPGKKVSLIDEVCHIRWPPASNQTPANQAAALFKARDKLNELAAPASGLTIAYTLLFAPGQTGADNRSHTQFPQYLAHQAYPHLAESAARLRRWLRILLIFMIAGLAVTSLLSWYVAYGSLVLQRIEQLDGQRAELGEALDALLNISRSAASTVPTRGTPSEAWLRGESELSNRLNDNNNFSAADPHVLERARDAAKRLISKREAADEALDEWTSFLWPPRSAGWMLGPARKAGDTVPKPPDDPILVERKEQWSANLLIILGNYVLPMMYGFLGAAAAAMVNLNQKVRSSRLTPRDRRMSQVQLALGVITGACIGLFLSPSAVGTSGATLSGRSVALSASALSFLAGFGVEGVFKMLENILITAFGGQPHIPPPST